MKADVHTADELSGAAESGSTIPDLNSPDENPAGSWDLFTRGQRRMLLFVLFLIASSGAIDRAIIVILLEPIKEEFHVSDAALGLLSGVAFGIFYTILGIPIARYADRGNRRLLITASVTLWSLFTATCGAARSFLQLFLLRIGVGVGEAGGTGAPLMSLLYDYFPPKQHARAVSIVNMSMLSGAVVGLIIGGFIAQHYGWRVTLACAGLPGLFVALLAFFTLREPRTMGNFSSSAVAAAQESLIDAFRALIKKPTFLNIAIAQLCFTFLANGALTFSQIYVIRVLKASVSETGAVTGVLTIVSVLVGNIVGGLLTDRLSRRNVAWLCRIPAYGMAVSFLFYCAAFLTPTLAGFTAFSTVAGAVMIGSVPAIFISLLTVVGASRRATGFTIVQLFANLIGVTMGPIVTGLMSDTLTHFLGPAEGIRWAIVVSMLAFLPSSWFMLRAARTIAADQET